MKISEAIKIGMQGRHQRRGLYFDLYTEDVSEIKECCALGAAYLGWFQATKTPLKAPFQLPFEAGHIISKFECIQDQSGIVRDIIQWNDFYKLSFDEIIAKLEERGM